MRLAGAAGELLAHVLDHYPLAGTRSSVSVTSSPSLRRRPPPQHGQADGARIDDALARQMLRQRPARRLAPGEGAAPRSSRLLALAAANCACASASEASSSISESCSSSCSSTAPRSDDCPNRSWRSFAIVNLAARSAVPGHALRPRHCAPLPALPGMPPGAAITIALRVASIGGGKSAVLIAKMESQHAAVV